MLPNYKYDKPAELIPDRVRALYERESLLLSSRQRQFKQSDLIRREVVGSGSSEKLSLYECADANLNKLVGDERAAKKYMKEMQKTNEELGYETSLEEYERLPALLFRSTESLELYAKNKDQHEEFEEAARQGRAQLSRSQTQNNDIFRLWHGGACQYRGARVLSHELARSKVAAQAGRAESRQGGEPTEGGKSGARRRAASAELRCAFSLSQRGFVRAEQAKE